MSASEVAQAFVNHYYPTRDQNPDGVAGLYNQTSMLTVEGAQVQGSAAIVEKLKSLGQVKHTVKSMDVQPSTSDSAMLVAVTGAIQMGEGNPNPLHFSETFQLVSTGAAGSFYVHNQLFRLHYGL